MLKCYVDDSGSDNKPGGIFLLAGYVMPEGRWEDFAELWDVQLKRDHPIDYLHMTDAESGDGQFRGMDSVFRKRKVKDLALVIQQCHPEPITCLLHWKDYNAIVKGKVHPKLDNPYSILFFKVMAIVSELQIRANQELPEDVKKQLGVDYKPVEFIFDDQGGMGLQCLHWYAGLREGVKEPHRTMIANTPQFKRDSDLAPLQAADMLAWHIRRHYAFPQEDRSDIFGLLQPDGIWQYEVNVKELEDIVHTFNNEIDQSSI